MTRRDAARCAELYAALRTSTSKRSGTPLSVDYHRNALSEARTFFSICGEAKVPVVTAHGMRGTHATLATDAGMSGRAVAGALGHTAPTTTYRSYAKAEAVEASRQRRVIEVIEPTEWGTKEPFPSDPHREPTTTKAPRKLSERLVKQWS